MRAISQKLISIILAATMIITASAVAVSALGEYTPSEGVETNRYYFAMPGAWANEMTRAQNNACGAYWWSGEDAPDSVPEANYHGWPGYRMYRDDSVENLRYINVSKQTYSIDFNNYIDGGDEASPQHAYAKQTVNINLEGDWMDLDGTTLYEDFWTYVLIHYVDDIKADSNFKIREFGNYSGNVSYNAEEDDLVLSYDNMIYVIDLTNGDAAGSFYFYYGNGEYGSMPTKELLTAGKGVQFDADGKVILDNELIDSNGNIYRYILGQKCVVYGKIDEGKYIEDYYGSVEPATEEPTEPEDEEYLIGDLNFDGTISVFDATLVQEHAAEIIEFDDAESFAADCNGDETVTVADATLIQKYAAEFDEDLLLTGQRRKMSAVSSGYLWPCPGYYLLSSSYSDHGAIDICGKDIMGAPVFAAENGTVMYTNNSCTHNFGKAESCGCGGGYGNYVWLSHGNGKETIYGHLTSAAVAEGSAVKKGDLIGYVGSTGQSTGPHLHFECRQDGVRYDPMSEF